MAQRVPGYRTADRRQVHSSSWPRPARRPASPSRAPAMTCSTASTRAGCSTWTSPAVAAACHRRPARLAPPPPLLSLLCRPRHVHFRPGAVADRGQFCAGRAVGVRPARLHPGLLLHVRWLACFLVGGGPCVRASLVGGREASRRAASSTLFVLSPPCRRFAWSTADTALPHAVLTLLKLIRTRCPIVLQAHRLHGPPRAPRLQLERHPRPTTPTRPAVGAVCRTLALKQALLLLPSTST